MINCYEYCINRVKYDLGNCLDDEMVKMAADIEEMEEQVKDLRMSRWSFASLSLNRAGTPSIQVLDMPGFKKSLETEDALLADIAGKRARFAELNPVFLQAQESLVRFNRPTLKHLLEYRQDALNRAFLMDRELKTHIHYLITSDKYRHMTTDEVLASPEFLAHKAQVETTIKGLQEEAKKAEEFINKIEGILRN